MMPEDKATIAGQAIVDLFGLKPLPNKDKTIKQYHTTWGKKTLSGLGRCVERIARGGKIQDSEDESK